MPQLSKLTLSTLVLALATSMMAQADGVYKMYDYRGEYIDELEIVKDVVGTDGYEYAMHVMANMQMTFYIPPEVTYVEVSATNPIIANGTPYQGYWVSTAPQNEERWADCARGPIRDHEGVQRYVYGDLEYFYTGLDDDGLWFDLQIGHCGDEIREWAFHNSLAIEEIRPTLSELMDACGNDPDVELRALACSEVIASPEAQPLDVSHALWTRAYVRCDRAPFEDVVSDLMAAARLDTAEWQQYYYNTSGYTGPIDGRVNDQLLAAIEDWVRSCIN